MRRARSAIIGYKLFARVNGAWIGSGFKKEMPLVKITCLSDEYFTLLADHQEIARRRSPLSTIYRPWLTESFSVQKKIP